MTAAAAEAKRNAARAALEFVQDDTVIGVGTGSTVNFFIEALAERAQWLQGAVSSSEASTRLLQQAGIPVLDLNAAGPLDLYVDGADEANAALELIKGGGGALTREKIVAAASRRFVCIVDRGKLVQRLGHFPLPVEVIPMARSHVARQIVALGGDPAYRSGVTTDNGNVILDIHNLEILDAPGFESELNQIAGVVCNGLFARRPADLLLVGDAGGVERLEAPR